MNKLKLALKILMILLLHPRKSAGVLYEKYMESKYESNIISPLKVLDLIEVIGGREIPDLYPVSYLSDGSGATDYALLAGLAKQFEKCNYLEIGTWRGESICCVSPYATECVSVSLGSDDMIELGLDDYSKVIDFYCKQLKYSNIQLVKANSKTFDFASLNKKFDIIFIDGDHSYEMICNDTKKVLPLLRDENSIIVWHDYLLGNEKIRMSTLKAIYDTIPSDEQQYLYSVRNTMCAIYSRKHYINVSGYESFPAIPKSAFKVNIKEIKL